MIHPNLIDYKSGTDAQYYVLSVDGNIADCSEICQSLTLEGLGFYCEAVKAREDYWRFWLRDDALPWLERTGQLYNPAFTTSQ